MARRGKKIEKCLTIEEALRFAIRREVDAAKGYAEMSRKAKNESSKALLEELSSEEENHRRLLEDLAAGKAVPLMTGEVEDLHLSDSIIEEPLEEGSGFQDLLIFAAKKEAQAVELYTRLLKQCPRPDQKRLFEFLVQQEKIHKLKLEKEYEAAILPED